MRKLILLTLLLSPSLTVTAQSASFVYRLGKDTVALEQYSKSGNRLTGDIVSRQGPVVTRLQYDASYAADGRVSAVTYKIFGSDGKPMTGRPTEIRYTVKGDSVTRVVVWADSTPTRSFAATNIVAFANPAYGMLEPAFAMLRKGNMTTPAFTVLGAGAGATLGSLTLAAGTGDTIRNSASGLVFVVGRDGLLRAVDGSGTTGKITASRANGGLDIAGLASRMTPTGVLSSRGTSRGSFQTNAPGGVIMVDYGRPQVRERTVWGGLLIPPDTIWRLGANEATHFATSRDLDFGGTVVPAGLYTLFLYNAKSGPMLAVNKQVGQWGTMYDQAKDLVRIPLTMSPTKEHVEEFTINVRQAAPSRGALEIAWGNQMATANFTVK